MTFHFRFISAAVVLCALMFGGCKHLPKPKPGSVSIYSEQLADAIRVVAFHDVRAISPVSWGTILLIPPDQVTARLACHELEHNKYFATFDSEADALADYLGKFVKSTVDAAIERANTQMLVLVQMLLTGAVTPKEMLRDVPHEIEILLRLGYVGHPDEIAAVEACKHLEGAP